MLSIRTEIAVVDAVDLLKTVGAFAGGMFAGGGTVLRLLGDRERRARGRAVLISEMRALFLTVDIQARTGAVWEPALLAPALARFREQLDGAPGEALTGRQMEQSRDALHELERVTDYMVNVLLAQQEPRSGSGEDLANFYERRRRALMSLFKQSRELLAAARIGLGDSTPIMPLKAIW